MLCFVWQMECEWSFPTGTAVGGSRWANGKYRLSLSIAVIKSQRPKNKNEGKFFKLKIHSFAISHRITSRRVSSSFVGDTQRTRLVLAQVHYYFSCIRPGT